MFGRFVVELDAALYDDVDGFALFDLDADLPKEIVVDFLEVLYDAVEMIHALSRRFGFFQYFSQLLLHGPGTR